MKVKYQSERTGKVYLSEFQCLLDENMLDITAYMGSTMIDLEKCKDIYDLFRDVTVLIINSDKAAEFLNNIIKNYDDLSKQFSTTITNDIYVWCYPINQYLPMSVIVTMEELVDEIRAKYKKKKTQ